MVRGLFEPYGTRAVSPRRQRPQRPRRPRGDRGQDLVDGAAARVASAAGEVLAPVEISDEVRPGVVSLPHGFGHDLAGVRMVVARAHAGVNVNRVSDPAFVDAPSHNAAFNGVPVDVRPASP